MWRSVPLLLVTLSVAFAAPTALFENNPIAVPHKRAALVLDRLLIALQKALHEDASRQEVEQTNRDWPQTAPLRIDSENSGDMREQFEEVHPLAYEFPERDVPDAVPLRLNSDEDIDMTGLQRRGQAAPARGRVLRCYFNAVTCF